MIAAVYARKSTEQTGVADEQKSIARQVEPARSYTRSKGWIVADEHVYVDDGISGAEFANRPGFLQHDECAEASRAVPSRDRVGRVAARLGSGRDRCERLKQQVADGARVLFIPTNLGLSAGAAALWYVDITGEMRRAA